MKRVLMLTITLLVLLTLSTPMTTSASSDINGHAHESDIRALINKGIMNGYEDGSYRPDKSVTRAQFTKLVVEALSIDTNIKGAPASFTDVVAGQWYYPSVIAATNARLINGNGDQIFRPNDNITRQEIAVIIKRSLDLKDVSLEQSPFDFSDGYSIASWAKSDIEQLVSANIIKGKEKDGLTYFGPTEYATRGQTASFVNRMLDQIKSQDAPQEAPQEKPQVKPEDKPVDKPKDEPKSTTKYTKYNYNFKTMVDKQMKVRPQTDSKGTWYHASEKLVEHQANPNNFTNPASAEYFQFLSLSGSAGVSSADLNSRILLNKGTLQGTAATFMEASKKYNVNEIYLIAHAMLETGNGSSDLASGIEVGLNKAGKATMVTNHNRKDLTAIKHTYNMYGIGAYDHCALKCGSERAYENKWFTPEKAIVDGAEFIDNGYIGAGQDTLYKMRWNPANPATHQYATDVGWPVKQTKRMKMMFELFDQLGTNSLVFDVPVFNSPVAASARPTGINQFHVDTKLAGEVGFVKVTNTNLRLRQGPTTGFPIITQLANNTKVTIIGENAGWYKVTVGANQGWVSGNYLRFENTIKASALSLPETNEQEEQIAVIGQTTLEEGTPLQSEPLLTDNIINELAIGTDVQILDHVDHWYQVTINNETGWIYEDYLHVE